MVADSVADSVADRQRRRLLQQLGLGLALPLVGCGGGGGTAATDATASSADTASADSGIWPWAGTSTTAEAPSIDDFVEVVADGSVVYPFHASIVSSTTDPVSGETSDTSSTATLAPYWISKLLVTNAQWKAFCNAMGSSWWPSTARTAGQYWYGGAYPADKEDHPVFFVSLVAARAYCAWLETQIDGWHFYVPTEGEWEYAALGANAGFSYPWGAAAGISYDASSGALITPFNCNADCTQYVLWLSNLTTLTYRNDSVVTMLSDGTALVDDSAPLARVLAMNASGGVSGWQYDSDSNRAFADFANSDVFRELVSVYGGFSTPVGHYAAGQSWCGCHDMAGNAYEWTSTMNVASNGAESGSSVNCVKGGSWYATASSGKSSGRGEGRSASGAYHSVGFRVAARAK